MSSEPIFELMKDGVRHKLVAPFQTCVKGELIKIPAGFVTDFASVPRFFWRISPPLGLYSKAALIHDYLYQSGLFDKETADEIFLIAMKQAGVPSWKAQLMYRAVKIFGGAAWKVCRKRDKELPVNVGGPEQK